MLKTSNHSAHLDELVAMVLATSKYRDVCPDLVRSIGIQELAKRRNLKEALKATKNKLHQVGGAYLESRQHPDVWLQELQRAVQSQDTSELQTTCRKIMSYHVSTHERLCILDHFYATIFAELPPISSILDLACGLNPLSLPWLPLQKPFSYYAYDIYQHITDLLHQWLLLMQVEGQASVCDVIQSCPTHEVDVAFILKTLPCLEQIDKHAGYHLLRAIHARHLVVSFPVQSLGGKGKGMAAHYEAQFYALIESEPWQVKRLEFATELVFVISK